MHSRRRSGRVGRPLNLVVRCLVRLSAWLRRYAAAIVAVAVFGLAFTGIEALTLHRLLLATARAEKAEMLLGIRSSLDDLSAAANELRACTSERLTQHTRESMLEIYAEWRSTLEQQYRAVERVRISAKSVRILRLYMPLLVNTDGFLKQVRGVCPLK